MTAVYVGSLTIGAAVPGAATSAQAGFDGIDAAFPDLQARVDALVAEVAALATMPPLPSFADMLARAVELQASITLAMATPGLPPPPSIAGAIAALNALLADLTAMSVDLNAKLDGIVAFQTLLAGAGVHVIATDGALSGIGADIQGCVNTSVGSGHANAIALITTDALTWSKMSAVFKVTP